MYKIPDLIKPKYYTSVEGGYWKRWHAGSFDKSILDIKPSVRYKTIWFNGINFHSLIIQHNKRWDCVNKRITQRFSKEEIEAIEKRLNE